MNSLSDFVLVGLTEREAVRVVMASKGHENAAEAFAWTFQAVVAVGNRDQCGAVTGGLAVERVRDMTRGVVPFRDDDPSFPDVSPRDIMYVMAGAEELCNLILQRIKFQLGN